MSDFAEVPKPIINSPYEEPKQYYEIAKGEPPVLVQGRRPACYYYRPPGRSTGRHAADEVGTKIDLHLVNDIRARMKEWREKGYPGVTGTTGELIGYWTRPEREAGHRLFFCQLEAALTVIFLKEARADFLQGLEIPRDEPSKEAKEKGYSGFTRYAAKMATGSGKTTVMGMLAAWSILNKVADRGNATFSDTVLVICPNVTIRDRLQELDPNHGETSLYRTRDLVPPDMMKNLREGRVLITNWHVLEPKELNTVGKDSSRVVKRGVPRHVKLDNGDIDTKYIQSDTSLVEDVLKETKGKKNILVFNDEAHHAYRIAQTITEEEQPDLLGGNGNGDSEELEYYKKEATIWIDGLDKINKIRGINFCVDLSATPFYLNNTGNDPGKSFPWVVSDFGLVDAIESGLVKIPQLPIEDTTGRRIPAYFNVWKWIVEEKLTSGEKGGKRGQVNPKAVLKYAHTPIQMLASLWKTTFKEWNEDVKKGSREPVPPVFIIVCRDTRLAKIIYDWIADCKGEDITPCIPEFRNKDGKEYTVRVDSKVVEEIESGIAKSDESRRLRFVLDTIGKTAWPGGKPPEEYVQLVNKRNEKAEEGGELVDQAIPPGRDVRCIVSVAMLTEGWDARTVTHIVGLRPFESQLLCEQVVGRGLRRSQYHDLSVEEVSKVYGVPFELIPFKTNPTGPTPPPPKVIHVKALPERADLEIKFPRVEGYSFKVKNKIAVDWQRVRPIRIDPAEVPDETLVKGLSTDDAGKLSLSGPGPIEEITLKAWRKGVRLQYVEFFMANELRRHYAGSPDCEIPPHILFPQLISIVKRFVRDYVEALEHRDKKDIFLSPYFGKALEVLKESIIPDVSSGEESEIPTYEKSRGPGSTSDVDTWTSKPVVECRKSHLNYAVADTEKWEQIAKFYLDRNKHVISFVKNFGLGFEIPYTFNGESRGYAPDFIIRLKNDEGREIGNLILEVKGFAPEEAEAKKSAAIRWMKAVNNEGSYGKWDYRVIYKTTDVDKAIEEMVKVLG